MLNKYEIEIPNQVVRALGLMDKEVLIHKERVSGLLFPTEYVILRTSQASVVFISMGFYGFTPGAEKYLSLY